jgi:hypothetical protein
MVRTVGFAAGLVLAALALLSWRVPASGDELGLDVRLVATPPGELLAESSEPFLAGRGLVPGGDPAEGRMTVRNVAGRRLAFRVRGLPSARGLDDLLHVELRAGDEPLARGPLGDLRRWTDRSFELDASESATLTARAWLPEAAGRGYEARILDVTVELRAGEPR